MLCVHNRKLVVCYICMCMGLGQLGVRGVVRGALGAWMGGLGRGRGHCY